MLLHIPGRTLYYDGETGHAKTNPTGGSRSSPVVWSENKKAMILAPVGRSKKTWQNTVSVNMRYWLLSPGQRRPDRTRCQSTCVIGSCRQVKEDLTEHGVCRHALLAPVGRSKKTWQNTVSVDMCYWLLSAGQRRPDRTRCLSTCVIGFCRQVKEDLTEHGVCRHALLAPVGRSKKTWQNTVTVDMRYWLLSAGQRGPDRTRCLSTCVIGSCRQVKEDLTEHSVCRHALLAPVGRSKKTWQNTVSVDMRYWLLSAGQRRPDTADRTRCQSTCVFWKLTHGM